jgi:hypothetical protein
MLLCHRLLLHLDVTLLHLPRSRRLLSLHMCVLLHTVLKPADALDILKAVALAADLASVTQATALLPIVYNVLLHVIAPASADTSADAAASGAAVVRRHVYVI